MKSRAFIGYLVGYDSTNIFRVWNPDKGDVSGYRNVIFNEKEFFDTYDQKNVLKEAERAEFIEFRVFKTRSAVQFDSDDEDWMNLPIRGRLGAIPEPEGVGDDSDEDEDQPLTPRRPAPPETPRHLETPEDTPFMTPDQSATPPYVPHFTGDERTSRFAYGTGENAEAFSSKNVSQRKKRAKTTKTVAMEDLPETGQTPLEVTRFKPKRSEISADLYEVFLNLSVRSLSHCIII